MSIFDTLREQIPLERVIQANGHGKVRCISPEHEDPSPSMHVYDTHVHCYGCQFRGDVTDVWGAIRAIGRPIEAALDLAREFNVKLPEMSDEARQKSEEGRQKEGEYLRLAQACHAALEKHVSVRKWWEGRGFGPELRERFLLGANKDRTEAVIPFWSRGRVLFLVHRRLEGEPKYILPEAEDLPDGHKPLFIPAPLKGEIFLTEGYVDALTVATSGKSAVAVGGTNLSGEQRAEMRRLFPEDARLYILTDDDDSGSQAARSWGREFFPQAKVCEASYGEEGKDIADVFARAGAEKTAEHLDRLAACARDLIDIETEVAATLEGGVRERLAYATENVVPLLARISPDALQDATADIVAEKVKLKKNWLNNAIKEEKARLSAEAMAALAQEAQKKIERRRQEYQERIEEAQPEIDALLKPGVLAKLRDTAAAMHNVHGDKEPLELALLVALGAQLAPLPNGRPLGASILLTAQAGRGKNHIVDAAVKPLPEEFYFAFEIVSGQSLYYKADEDPEFLKHTFAYPNEIEGAEALWQFLRPMLSKGWAKKIVTAKDAGGNMTTRTIRVEGPVTIAIPTIRNKTDEQLQTRLLVAELPDYPGRVKQHAAAISEQLLPDAAVADYSHEKFLWREALRQLTERRRVVISLRHPDFALDDDNLSHGARLWANLLSLMATNAWLEQRNNRLLELSSAEVAIEATPDDYAVAHRIFTKICKRTVVNLSDTHRAILDGLYELEREDSGSDGFSQRKIAEKAKVTQGTVSNHKTFLVMSAKLIRETDYGLALVTDADPSWWKEGDMMKGLPTPAQVRAWWGEHVPLPEPPNQPNHPAENNEEPPTYADLGDQRGVNHSLIAPDSTTEDINHDQQVINEELISENGLPRRDTSDSEDRDHVISPISGSEGKQEIERPSGSQRRLTPEQVEKYKRLVAEGMLPELARAAVRREKVEL